MIPPAAEVFQVDNQAGLPPVPGDTQVEQVHRSPRPATPGIPPPADGAILGPALNLKAFKELKPLPHDDDEDGSERLDLVRWFEDFESACWRGHGSGAVQQPW